MHACMYRYKCANEARRQQEEMARFNTNMSQRTLLTKVRARTGVDPIHRQ